MDISRRIARILGPVAIALAVTEWANMDIFAAQTAPVVYLNGTVLFACGVAILQAHARWRADWTALVTLTGWLITIAGLWRMAMPGATQAADGPATNVMFVIIALAGAVMTWGGYRPAASRASSSSIKD